MGLGEEGRPYAISHDVAESNGTVALSDIVIFPSNVEKTGLTID